MIPLRIISLLPSATEMVYALGLGSLLVGRSHECDFPAAVRSLPVCCHPAFPVSGSSLDIHAAVKSQLANAASLYAIDTAVIAALQPTLIVTQSQCAVCAVSLADVEFALQAQTGTKARLISLEPNSLSDIWQDIIRLAGACGQTEAGQTLVAGLTGRMQDIASQAATAVHRPTVACIEWLEPLMAAGNWIPELIEQAAGRDLFGEAGKHSPWMKWADVLAADPEAIIALPCGFDLQRTRGEMYWLAQRPGWSELTAVRSGSVFLCDGNQFMNRPGPGVVESLRIFAEILHPELFWPTLEHSGWERFSSS